MLLLLMPTQNSDAYQAVSDAFSAMYRKVTKQDIREAYEDDGTSDLIVIGSDAVNDFVMQEILENENLTLPIRYGTDDYCVRSYQKDGRNILIFAGGRVRSTLYAVYDYFETYLGCHYFWDGDVIPETAEIPLEGIRIEEKETFLYRGLRYFAHRGLKRFQAEHWSFADWKQELDWMTKKRLNFFMLRIGMDDLWQRAFPEDVPYPDGYRTITGNDAHGYDDRSDFWTLKYRGELRKQIMDYANRLDLMHPVDCGTMTHWYSRTPVEYLEKYQPVFLEQADNHYIGSDTGKIWDFRIRENLDRYMHLTDTCVREFDHTTGLFHTIGIAERRLYNERKKNLDLKLFAYRRIAERIHTAYPDAKLMLASWDFLGWWTGEEVQTLISELDPERTIILDYTSDAVDPDSTFLNWGIIGKFPYIFGIFHAYESESELRGAYDRTEERYRAAYQDPFCKGVIFWPELSHSDPLILEYLTEKAWSPSEKTIEQITKEFCDKRYGRNAAFMNTCWQTLLPFIKQNSWGGFTQKQPGDANYKEYHGNGSMNRDIWTRMSSYRKVPVYDPIRMEYCEDKIQAALPLSDSIVSMFREISQRKELFCNPFLNRDITDMARTVVGRYLNFTAERSFCLTGKPEAVKQYRTCYRSLLQAMLHVLCINDDCSLYQTLQTLKETAPTNPDFEITLKRNIANDYCAQACYETASQIYQKEAELVFDVLADPSLENTINDGLHTIYDQYYQMPLADMQPSETIAPEQAIREAALAVEQASQLFKTIGHT